MADGKSVYNINTKGRTPILKISTPGQWERISPRENQYTQKGKNKDLAHHQKRVNDQNKKHRQNM